MLAIRMLEISHRDRMTYRLIASALFFLPSEKQTSEKLTHRVLSTVERWIPVGRQC